VEDLVDEDGAGDESGPWRLSSRPGIWGAVFTAAFEEFAERGGRKRFAFDGADDARRGEGGDFSSGLARVPDMAARFLERAGGAEKL